MSEHRALTLRIHPESDHLWAEVEEMPGVFASGQDLEELREALAEAISLYLTEDGREPEQVKVFFDMFPREVTRLPARAELACV